MTRCICLGVSKIISESPHLSYLDVRSNSQINNDILETALLMDRKIHILCEDTKVNPVKFCYKYETTTKDLIERNYFKFAYKNLTFESSLPKKIDAKEGGEDLWIDDCQVYCLDDDENDDHSYSELFEGNEEYDDEYDDYDDMDFLENDGETEMLNELDC